eukprot:10747581-Alexandrium_andersonii.AAC.1
MILLERGGGVQEGRNPSDETREGSPRRTLQTVPNTLQSSKIFITTHSAPAMMNIAAEITCLALGVYPKLSK